MPHLSPKKWIALTFCRKPEKMVMVLIRRAMVLMKNNRYQMKKQNRSLRKTKLFSFERYFSCNLIQNEELVKEINKMIKKE
jgi:hypothetical protein